MRARRVPCWRDPKQVDATQCEEKRMLDWRENLEKCKPWPLWRSNGDEGKRRSRLERPGKRFGPTPGGRRVQPTWVHETLSSVPKLESQIAVTPKQVQDCNQGRRSFGGQGPRKAMIRHACTILRLPIPKF
eukprot:scaffold121408_cov30-Tisochrysis_lutea.AAC.6